MGIKFLTFVTFVCQFIPEIKQPDRKIQSREKILWTAMTLFIFLMFCQIPVFGATTLNSTDSLRSIRVILASSPGTLMELGISPIITSDLIMKLLARAKMIEPDDISKNHDLFIIAGKLLAMIVAIGQTIIYIMTGMYGVSSEIGGGKCLLIIIQFCVVVLAVLLLDELLQKGYGFASGIPLFIATRICGIIVWETFSSIRINTGSRTKIEGSIIALFHVLVTGNDRIEALYEVLYRQNLPNLMNLLATVFLFAIIIYLNGCHIDVSIKSTRSQAQTLSYPVPVLYTSYVPIIFHPLIVSYLYLISQMLSTNFSRNLLTNLLGVWIINEANFSYPIGGICYYLSPPRSFQDMLTDPIHATFYVVFILSSYGFLSRMLIGIYGLSAKDIVKYLKEQQLIIDDKIEKSTVHQLDRCIPTAATFAGLCIGAISVLADLIGVIGSGIGILLVIRVVSKYLKIIITEQREFGGMRRLLF